MDSFSSLLKKENRGQFVLAILFIIYLILGYRTPDKIASAIDSLIGKISLFFIVVYMFLYTNPILAVLSLFVAVDLIRRSTISTGSYALQQFLPSEIKKTSQFTAYNQFPYTLEQEVVKKMAPIVQSGSSLKKASYVPILDNLYDASPVNSSD